ncbi:MAG: Phenylalanine--tRNA ligase beta subunit [Chlamydiae bacterium]|nr:Phenylalanine--tRNA ligase beta subunit [Chlamydiota bacterium]
MKIPLSWLKEYIETNLSPEEIAESLTLIGLEVDGVESVGEDFVFEIALTPNLAHCNSIRGVARELAAITQDRLHLSKFSEAAEKRELPIEEKVSVTVEASEECPRYACRLIEGVEVAPSPSWLRERIEACGIRSVNNVVDSTNLVLLELGHPLHPFDFDTLAGGKIVVRMGNAHDALKTLDGQERTPTAETLLICDEKKPVAFAGVMGSEKTEVTEKTVNVLLESAYFSPSAVRKTTKRMELQTEASYRFERGTDPNGVLEALERATALICELAGGTARHGILDVGKKEFPPQTVPCRIDRVNRVLGTKLSFSEIASIFKRIGFSMVEQTQESITLSIPTYRHDVSHEIDLVEEVARLYGFTNIEKQEASLYREGNLPHCSEYLFEQKVRKALLREGLQELLTCDLISPAAASLVTSDSMPKRAQIHLLNPASQEQSVLRTSLLPGLLQVVKHNHDFGTFSLAGFEVGRVHFSNKGEFFEPTVVSLIFTGQKAPSNWEEKPETIDFYHLKGAVENLLAQLAISGGTFVPSQDPHFHPGRQAALKIEDVEVGIVGQIHPETAGQGSKSQEVYFAELSLEDLYRFVETEKKMKPLSQFPSSKRDWTITLPESLPVGMLIAAIEEANSPILEALTVADLYRDPKIGGDKKNATLHFVYRDQKKTLSVDEVEKEHNRITRHGQNKLNL